MEPAEQKKWEALPRGSILAACIAKHVQYIGFADRRAQGIIAINTFIIPIALAGLSQTQFILSAVLAVITAICTITTAILSLYPKRYSHKGHGHRNLLHFSDIKDLTEDEYLNLMQEATSDPGKLTQLAATDIHHLATHILKSKIYWLKMSYFIFLGGYTTTIFALLIY